MPSRRRRHRPRTIARQAIELSLAVPQVMTHRLARLALTGANPSARDRREFHRMGTEKLAALYESWNAMFLAVFRAYSELALLPILLWSGRRRRMSADVLGAGLAPFHRRATANARRLRRTRIM